MPARFVSACALAAMALALCAGVANGSNRPLETGIAVTDIGAPTQLEYERVRDLGAGNVRVLIFWDQVAPASKPDVWNPADPFDPNYDWTNFDSQVRLAVNAGLTPFIEIYSAPRWAERCRRETKGICNPAPVDFARFSLAAAKRYSGSFPNLPRVRFWQPWNEPNLHLFFQPQFRNGNKVSPALYRELLNRFAGAVKSVHRSNLVIAGGLAPLQRPGGLGPLDFARRLLCMEGRKKPKPKRGCKAKARFDIWANNPFTTGGPTHKSAGIDDVSLGDLPKMSQLLKSARRAGKINTSRGSVAYWVTEFSWDSKPPDPGGLPMWILTRWTSEALYRAWSAGVSKFFWLSLRDWPRPEGLPYSQTYESGLYFRGATVEEDRPKNNLRAFQFPFVAFPGKKGITTWGRTPSSRPGRVFIEYRNGGGWRRLSVVRANRFGVFRSFVRTRIAKRLAQRKRAVVRAKYQGGESRPFSLRPVKDFRHPPFGKP